MAYYPYFPQDDAIYTLTASDGLKAVFNDETDPDYVGRATQVTGLDSPEIREKAEDLVESDGGSHGDFYFGRRPISIRALLYGHTSAEERAIRGDKLRRCVLSAMRGDTILSWTPNPEPAVWVEMFTPVRCQQPLRASGGWNKEVQVQLVSEFANLFSLAQHQLSHIDPAPSIVVENKGDAPAALVVRIYGAGTPTTITNTTTGLVVNFTGAPAIANGAYVDVDILNQEAVHSSGTSWNRYLNYTTSTWPFALKGNNTITVTYSGGTDAASGARVTWRDTWR